MVAAPNAAEDCVRANEAAGQSIIVCRDTHLRHTALCSRVLQALLAAHDAAEARAEALEAVGTELQAQCSALQTAGSATKSDAAGPSADAAGAWFVACAHPFVRNRCPS